MEKQRRGIRFPTFSLEESLRVARAVQEQGGGRLAPGAAAVALGLSPTSSSFISRVASARHFGLLEDEDEVFKTTPLAKRILRPTNADQERHGLAEAFQSFRVFKELMDRFHDTQLPDKTLLENILVLEYGISDVSKEIACSIFLDSGKFAGLISSTDKAVAFGSEQIERSTLPRSASPSTTKTDGKMVDFLINIGSLRTAIQLHAKVSGVALKELEMTTHDMFERTLELATELGLPASKMSLKIVNDRLGDSGFEDAARFLSYLEEGLKEDLKLGGVKKPD